MNTPAKYGELFWSFFKIGTFTIGGGYAMIPLMEKELVDRRRWLSHEDFLDILSVSQAMPGVFAVNMATNIGYKLRRVPGALASIVGNILMPIMIILGLATCFHYLRGNEVVEAIFRGMRPAVVALIASPVFRMAQVARVNWSNCWIPVASVVLIWLVGVSPTYIVLAAIAGGFIYGRLKNRKEGST